MDFTQTEIYDSAALAYARIDGLSVPANPVSDSADTNIVIPLIVTSYDAPNRNPKAATIATLPMMQTLSGQPDGTSNVKSAFAFGGQAATESPMEFEKITLQGNIDTPIDSKAMPLITSPTGERMHYCSLITAFWEGRMFVNSHGWWPIDPLWFRDPYGRRFDSPRIIDFTSPFTPGAPVRNSFTMVLVV